LRRGRCLAEIDRMMSRPRPGDRRLRAPSRWP
jgi:hypothetical protein